MTFNEFQVQCELYPYSMEHFNLVKECAELQLLMLHEEAQQFMAENTIPIDFLPANYMMEAVNAEDAKKNAVTLHEKGENIIKKIWRGFIKILRTFADLLGKLGDKIAQAAKDIIEATRKKQAEVNASKDGKVNKKGKGKNVLVVTKDVANNVKKVVDKWRNANNGADSIDISDKQPNLTAIVFWYIDGCEPMDIKYEAALSWMGCLGWGGIKNSSAALELKGKLKMNVPELDAVLRVSKLLENPSTLTNSKLESALTAIGNGVGETLNIPIDAKVFKKYNIDLRKASDAMAMALESVNRGEANGNTQLDSSAISKLPKLYSYVSTATSAAMKIFIAWDQLFWSVRKAYLVGLGLKQEQARAGNR